MTALILKFGSFIVLTWLASIAVYIGAAVYMSVIISVGWF